MQKFNKSDPESCLIKEISNGNEKAYEDLFFKYYYQLCKFAVNTTNCDDLARDAVQEVFLNIWINREAWVIKHSLKAYLYQAVRNHALNLAEQQRVRQKLSEKLYENPDQLSEYIVDENSSTAKDLSGLVSQIWDLVEAMPEQRKMVFELHRKHGLSYSEISEVMGIAKKTVENHMGKAFQEVREKLNPIVI